MKNVFNSFHVNCALRRDNHQGVQVRPPEISYLAHAKKLFTLPLRNIFCPRSFKLIK